MNSILLAGLILIQGVDVHRPVGPFSQALWLFQARADIEPNLPAQDRQLKAVLAKALAKDNSITFSEVDSFMTHETFKTIAGPDEAMSSTELSDAADQLVPASRSRLTPALREHLSLLSTTFDQIDTMHRDQVGRLADWIAKNYQPNTSLHVIVVCTGNSRRSMLGSCMGNAAAAYYGFDNLHFHSGGTSPTAFNSRTIATLKEIGFGVQPTGEEAIRGEPKTANPIYSVKWGDQLQSEEFSKHYANKANPQNGFAAIMVCTEADEGCPAVAGATLRLSMPYLDPKMYDDGQFEKPQYAERRDDIGRAMLAAICEARRQMYANGKAN